MGFLELASASGAEEESGQFQHWPMTLGSGRLGRSGSGQEGFPQHFCLDHACQLLADSPGWSVSKRAGIESRISEFALFLQPLDLFCRQGHGETDFS